MHFEAMFGSLRGRSGKITLFEYVKPYVKASGDVHDYVFAPTRVDTRFGSHDYEQESYVLGIKFRGTAKWQYVSGTLSLPQESDALFPDLPKSLALPAIKSVQID